MAAAKTRYKISNRSDQSWTTLISLVYCAVLQCAVIGELVREPPGCLFPDFLQASDIVQLTNSTPQSSDRGMGDWTWKYDGDIHVGKVWGGLYTIFSRQHSPHSRSTDETCPECQMHRKCVEQHGTYVFAVQHEEHRPTYQCIKFIQRSQTVVQLEVSDRHMTSEGICSQNLTLDHSPWISVNHYKTAVANCPFTGGYNFKDIWEYTRDHAGKRLCRHGSLSEKQAPVRVESDCVEKEGFTMHFREKSCIPSKSYFGKSQKLVCMATWQVDGDGFALLRKENERSFYCVRVVFDNLEVTTVVVYLDWECYRRSDLAGAGGKLSYSTSYAIFQQVEKRIISVPCSDELSTCSLYTDGDCQDKQCMQTCQQCLNSTGYPCEFDEDVIGNWDIRKPDHTITKLRIHQTQLHHSNLGILECVTFNPELRVALRAILWGTYQNGCYPRFLCIYYDTPATNVLRYRLSNVQQWPLELSDNSICDRDNFLMSPDLNDPKDTYEEKPWNIALKSTENIRRMSCIYPNDIPDSTSFVDDKNRSGCVTFRSRPSPKTISLVYVNKSLNPHTQEHGYFYNHEDQQHFHCIAAITYISSFKTVMTLTQGNIGEALCWMVVDDHTIVVVNTSSCNTQTALGILRKEGKFMPHLKFVLNLNVAGGEVATICRDISENNEKQWLAHLKHSVEKQDPTRNASSASYLHEFLRIYLFVPFIWIVLLPLLNLQYGHEE